GGGGGGVVTGVGRARAARGGVGGGVPVRAAEGGRADQGETGLRRIQDADHVFRLDELRHVQPRELCRMSERFHFRSSALGAMPPVVSKNVSRSRMIACGGNCSLCVVAAGCFLMAVPIASTSTKLEP